MKQTARIILSVFFFVVLFYLVPSFVQAQTPTPTPIGILQPLPGEANWQFDAEVTQVGRNAERARQLVYWVFTNPPVFNAAVLAQTWAFTRNVAYVLTLLVIIGLALHLVLSARRTGPIFSGISLGMEQLNLTTIILRVVGILLFITFSYLIVRGLIEGSEIMSRFFIERLGGEDLFNIVFSGGNVEENYSFIGFRNVDPYEQDMVTVSLLLVRLTSFTYNFLTVIVVLRHVVLMFLLIVSPFLTLLLPFIFIRNTGTIWIGEFLRWLFYGPLLALFLSALAKIWKSGIPYTFQFKEAGTKIVYPTGINILYGGPAQLLSPTNTGNYVDTYAEYVIALVMLWVAILLPWLLLRIFRDYCCDILERNQAILTQILDRIRTLGTPPAPSPVPVGPATTFGKKMQLPFRELLSTSDTTRISTSERLSKEKIIEKIKERELTNIQTHDLQRVLDLRVSSLKDIARLETRRETSSAIRSTLERIQNPISATTHAEREQFETLRGEFTKRAAAGDQAARNIIQAVTAHPSKVPQITVNVAPQLLKAAIEEPGVPIMLPQMRVPTAQVFTTQTIQTVSAKTQISREKVEQILKALPLAGTTSQDKVTLLSQRTNVSEKHVEAIVKETEKLRELGQPISIPIIRKISQETGVVEEKVQQVSDSIPLIQPTEEEKTVLVAKRTQSTKEEVQQVLAAVPASAVLVTTIPLPIVVARVATQTGVSREKTQRILEMIPTLAQTTTEEKIQVLSEKTGTPAEQVRAVLDATPPEEIPTARSQPQAPVTIEEYEEVRRMWMNHYRKSEVPVSDSIKSRQDWIIEDVQKLTNTINLLASPAVQDRQKGMEQVSTLLPFLLLGGFADLETMTYIKAKLEAAKLIQEELEHVEEVREKTKAEQEELVSIPTIQKIEEDKTMEVEASRELPLEEESKESSVNEEALPGFAEENDHPIEHKVNETPAKPDLPLQEKQNVQETEEPK
ncbi:hypothetical protein HY468_05955 [Candidatus Roizmanbacteria bacterium]|nr:hypothetical protein [Candidatus Roizmanbacteria bacterium]